MRKSKVEDAALRKVAACASRETGDARKAVELLTKAVRVAEESSGKLTEKEVDQAEHSLEIDKSAELINTLATQQRIALQACYTLLKKHHTKTTTGQAYGVYQEICCRKKYQPLTQRRFSDMISSLDLYGLINARLISMGRYGKTREIMGALPEKVINGLLGIQD